MIESSSVYGSAPQGRAIGALIMTGFGALWMAMGVRVLPRISRDWRVWLAIALLTGILSVTGVKQLRSGRQSDTSGSRPVVSDAERRAGNRFRIVLWLEWIPIVAIVVILNSMRRPELIMPAIALVVGLHFIPLARIFGFPLYYVTGAFMIALTLAAFLSQDPLRRQAIVGVGCGITLWATAGWMSI